MGKRYKAILNDIGAEFYPYDTVYEANEVKEELIKQVIIASPTDTHCYYIKKYGHLGPVLCEKPITTNVTELTDLLHYIRENNVNFTMMNQYKLLDDPMSAGPTYYDFYNTGKDGLSWDCIQILGLARGEVRVDNKSPIWKCQLNGKPISLSSMDHAYYNFVEDWLKYPGKQDPDYLIHLHKRASEHGARI